MIRWWQVERAIRWMRRKRVGLMTQTKEELSPKKAIRRFDVFAEYTRQDQLKKEVPEDVAAGYGIWLAKVVASRKFGAKSKEPSGAHKTYPEGEKFRSLDDELQTDQVFDIDIVLRMGREFYRDVFVPAIEKAREEGESYEDIRDEIRKDWKPAKR
jgi:hypothetical protein